MTSPNNPSSIPKKRKKKQSQKAQEILASGQTLAGLPPSTSSPAESVDMAPAQVVGEKRPRGRPSKASGLTTHAPVPAMSEAFEYRGQIFQIPRLNARKIYDWPRPGPASFVQLTNYFRKFKDKADKEEKSADIDDGADDWDSFCCPFDPEGDNRDTLSAAASVFIKQAKRAFWAGKTWEEFEKEQLQAKTVEEDFPNKVRLAVYHKIKTRLCEEIWSQKYQESAAQDSKIPSPDVEEPKVGPSNAPAIPLSVRPRNEHVAPPQKRPRLESPTAEQAENGITGISTDRFGVKQPLYEGETEAPSMDRHLAGARRDVAQTRDQVKTGARTAGEVADEVRYASANGVPLFKNQHGLSSWEMGVQQARLEMDTSDEDDNGNWP